MTDLSIIIVNYNSGWYSANLVDSLLDQVFQSPGGSRGSMEIIIVDNDSPIDQHELLDPLEKHGVKLIYSKDNSGYSGGCNLGMQYATGDYVMVANPDIIYFPGAIDAMMKTLYADRKIGMVGPRGWLDPGRHFYLPPLEMPTITAHLLETLGRTFPIIGRAFSHARSRRALRSWAGESRFMTGGLCGYGVIMPAHIARRLGPFDTTYPLYYEDSDLSMRIGRAGYGICYVKEAQAIHFYNKSAGLEFEESLQKFDWSKSYFYRKHYGLLTHALFRKTTDYLKRNIHDLPITSFTDVKVVGATDTNPELVVPTEAPVVVEITPDPSFVLAAGAFHQGGAYRMPDLTWQALDACSYFIRFMNVDCTKTLIVYRIDKTTPAEQSPTYAELKRLYY